MKVEVKIPKGWRRVRVEEKIIPGYMIPIGNRWIVTNVCGINNVILDSSCGPFIRKIKRKT